MAEYKLIKDFPMCPLEVGAIVTEDKLGQYVSEKVIIFEKEIIENYPEFWEKVEKMEYKVLTYVGTVHFIECNNVKIHSVKRLSDGEVFTLGDFIDFGNFGNKGFQKIDKFEIDYFNKTRITAYNSAYGIGIVRWKKAPKKTPLFTTEDGVEIFKGDTVWHTNLNTSKKPYSSIVEYKEPFKPVRGLFSTKEKAEEYFMLNKPCLSFNDIVNDIIDPNSLKAIKETVKNKLQL